MPATATVGEEAATPHQPQEPVLSAKAAYFGVELSRTAGRILA
jgi:hypothetical protein